MDYSRIEERPKANAKEAQSNLAQSHLIYVIPVETGIQINGMNKSNETNGTTSTLFFNVSTIFINNSESLLYSRVEIAVAARSGL